MAREPRKEFMSTNRQGWSNRRPKESAGRGSDGRSAPKDKGKIRREREKEDVLYRRKQKKRVHATAKCISGDTHPVRWNQTL